MTVVLRCSFAIASRIGARSIPLAASGKPVPQVGPNILIHTERGYVYWPQVPDYFPDANRRSA